MKAVLFTVTLILLNNLSTIKAGWDTKCEVEGADRYDWLGQFTVDKTINDDHEGIVATFKTENVLALTGQTSRYLNASFKDDVLTVYTNENFKKFEEEYNHGGWSPNVIQLVLDFDCVDNKSDSLNMQQKVVDVNNHDPVLNKEVYEFNFGMRIPQDYELTKFLPISASDFDFSNRYVYFSIDFNEYFKAVHKVERDYDDKKYYFTTLKTLKEIKAPFRKEFTLVARDDGNPARNSTALLVVSVASDDAGNGGENSPHPPVFAKHLYVGNYTADGNLEMVEPIRIKYGAQNNTKVTQSGYEKYFKIVLDAKTPGNLDVLRADLLPRSILETTGLIVIEIEAENEGLHMPGRTALIIRLPSVEKTEPENNFENGSKNCSVIYVSSSHGGTDFISFVIYLCIAFVVIVMNVGVLIWYFQRRGLNNPSQPASARQIPEIRKVPLY